VLLIWMNSVLIFQCLLRFLEVNEFNGSCSNPWSSLLVQRQRTISWNFEKERFLFSKLFFVLIRNLWYLPAFYHLYLDFMEFWIWQIGQIRPIPIKRDNHTVFLYIPITFRPLRVLPPLQLWIHTSSSCI
jgi:hypothetical protein